MDYNTFGAGKLKHRVTIREWQDLPDVGFGATPSYSNGNQVWAAHMPMGAGTILASQQIGEKITDRFVVRWRRNVIEARLISMRHVVEKDGIRYRVKSSSPLDGGQDFVVIDTEMLGPIA
jgi:head-tail adaptor